MMTAAMMRASTPTNAPAIDVVGSGPAAMVGVEVAADRSVVVCGSVLLYVHQLDKNTIKVLVKNKKSKAK